MTATYPPRTSLRPCRLYRFYVEQPLTGEVVLGYVGETGRQPFERLLEHLATQPWFDTVVRWEIDPQVFYGKDAVLRAESAAIRAERPLYNVRENERNKDRIIPAVAIRQWRARDAQAGEARWVHPDDRVSSPRPDRTSPVRAWPPFWTSPKKKAALWAAASLMLSALVDGQLHAHSPLQGLPALVVSVLTSGGLLGWGLWRKPDSVRMWRQRAKRASRLARKVRRLLWS